MAKKRSIDHSNIEAFRKAYENCEGPDNTVFVFEGNKVLKGYAKYLLQYWDGMQAATRLQNAGMMRHTHKPLEKAVLHRVKRSG